jgi:hypothetical protein
MRGCDRFTPMGGVWTKYDDNGNKIGEHVGLEMVLKHPEAEDRYIFEMWCPPENYGTEAQWSENFTKVINGQIVKTLGDYPGNGEYELLSHMGVLEKVTKDRKTGAIIKKEFVPLTETLCDAIVLTAKMNKELPVRIKVEAARERYAKEERDRIAKQADMLENMRRPKWADQGHIICPDMSEVAKYS